VIALAVPLAINAVERVRVDARSQAIAQADVVAAGANDFVSPPRLPDLQELARTSAVTVKGRVLILDGKGLLLADSASVGRVGADYSTRPEVKAALAGKSLQVQRRSRTLGREILATAVPIANFGATVGAVRITQSAEAVNDSITRAIVVTLSVAVVVLLLGLVVGWLLAGQLTRPLRRLEQVAVDIAEGDLDARAPVEGASEQRNLAEAFNEMTDRLVRMIDSQKQFVADASHQLRTPLAALRARVEEAREHRLPPEADEELDAGLREMERIRAMISDLLMLSQIGHGQAEPEAIDLNEACRIASARWTPIAAESGISLELGDAPAGVRATGWCGREDLDRALDAVLENAVRYSPAGSSVTIAVGDGTIEVADEVPGLAEGEEEHVFERFRRGVAGQAVAHGTGLGLAIARDLMRSYRGDVTIANRSSGGAKVTVAVAAQRRAAPSDGDTLAER